MRPKRVRLKKSRLLEQAVVEYPKPEGRLLTSRRKEFEPAIEALKPLIRALIKSTSRVRTMVAETELKWKMRGGFCDQAALRELMQFIEHQRAPQGIVQGSHYLLIEQSRVHPLARYYEFPAMQFNLKTKITRQLLPLERLTVVRNALFDLVREGLLVSQRKDHGIAFSVLPSPHGEEAPPHLPQGPSPSLGQRRPQERRRQGEGHEDLAGEP